MTRREKAEFARGSRGITRERRTHGDDARRLRRFLRRMARLAARLATRGEEIAR